MYFFSRNIVEKQLENVALPRDDCFGCANIVS